MIYFFVAFLCHFVRSPCFLAKKISFVKFRYNFLIFGIYYAV